MMNTFCDEADFNNNLETKLGEFGLRTERSVETVRIDDPGEKMDALDMARAYYQSMGAEIPTIAIKTPTGSMRPVDSAVSALEELYKCHAKVLGAVGDLFGLEVSKFDPTPYYNGGSLMMVKFPVQGIGPPYVYVDEE